MTLKTWQRTLLIAIAAIGVSWQVFTSGPSFEKLPQSAKQAILRDRDTVDSLFQKTGSAIKTGKLNDAQEYINNAKRLLKDISEFAPEISVLTEKVNVLHNLVHSIIAIQRD